MTVKKILIIHAPGTNRDGDLAAAFRLAGGEPEIVTLTKLVEKTDIRRPGFWPDRVNSPFFPGFYGLWR